MIAFMMILAGEDADGDDACEGDDDCEEGSLT